MVCQICGGTVGRGQRFCSACGTRISLEAPPIGSAGYAMPFAPRIASSRVSRHLQSLGVLWIVYGVFRLLRGIIGIVILRTMTLLSLSDFGWPPIGLLSPSFPYWMNILLPIVGALTILGTLLAFATGYALLTQRSWGRPLAMTAAILALIKFPFGTALAVYTLWVMAPAGSRVDQVALQGS